MTSSRSLPSRLGPGAINLVLLIIAALMFLPFVWLFVTSVLPDEDAFRLPPVWIPSRFNPDNFAAVFELIPFARFLLNSIKITLLITLGGLIVGVLAAYAFAKMRFPGRDLVFLLFLGSLMVPSQVTVAPTFILLRTLGLFDTHEAVYLPAMLNVLAIFLLRQWFLTVPGELTDAARIDGAGHLGILRHVMIPLSGPPLAALSIFIAQGAWNSFFWPNIMLTTPENLTIPVGLVYLQGEAGSGSPAVVFAGITVIVVPILVIFVCAQRTITSSVAMTSGVR